MFNGASAFNQPIGNWQLSGNQLFNSMFQSASAFNQSLSNWDVGSATTMSAMFAGASSFASDISSWNVAMVTDMSSMLAGSSVNSDLSSWAIGNVEDFSNMFFQSLFFRQNLCAWGRSIIPSAIVSSMFDQSGCPVTDDPDLDGVPRGPFCFGCLASDVTEQPTEAPTDSPTRSPVEVGQRCFTELSELSMAVDNYLEDPSGGLTAERWGHPIGSWCVSNIGTFNQLFSTRRNPAAATFNEDISQWDVSGADSFFGTFSGARAFNQGIEKLLP